MKDLGLLGPQYTYHDLARATFVGELSYTYFNSFEEVFTALKIGEIKQALVAITNNNAGKVGDNQERIIKEKFKQLEFFDLPIHLCIGSKVKLTLGQINKIYSHPMAIKETQSYFSNFSHLTFVPSISTAGAIEALKNNKNDQAAVISSKAAIEFNKLHLLAENIEDHENNMTRFCLIEV
jgi:prephenate dehydratase